MTIYTEEQLAELAKHGAPTASLFEFQFASGTEYLWNGAIDRSFGDSPVYKGMRGFIQMPNVPQSRVGNNSQEVVTISGMPPSFANMLEDHQSEVDDRLMIQRRQILSGLTLEPVGPARVCNIFVMRGTASTIDGGTVSGAAPNSTLGIKIETLFGSRSEAGFGRYTPEDQRGRFTNETDNMFNDVAQIAVGSPLAWP